MEAFLVFWAYLIGAIDPFTVKMPESTDVALLDCSKHSVIPSGDYECLQQTSEVNFRNLVDLRLGNTNVFFHVPHSGFLSPLYMLERQIHDNLDTQTLENDYKVHPSSM
ncbi:hypothetical protein ACOME3_009151 [Neoechinorhynchus agilis]